MTDTSNDNPSADTPSGLIDPEAVDPQSGSPARTILEAVAARFHELYPDSDPEDQAISVLYLSLLQTVDPRGHTDRAMAMVPLLVAQPPPALTSLSPLQALALAIALISNGRLRDDPEQSVEQWADVARTCFVAFADGEQRAASIAVAALGGPHRVALPVWQVMGLNDHDHVAPRELIDAAKLACARTAPGVGWSWVPVVQYVVYKLN